MACFALLCFVLQRGALICGLRGVLRDAHRLVDLYIGLLKFALLCFAVVCPLLMQCCDVFVLFRCSVFPMNPSDDASVPAMEHLSL